MLEDKKTETTSGEKRDAGLNDVEAETAKRQGSVCVCVGGSGGASSGMKQKR